MSLAEYDTTPRLVRGMWLSGGTAPMPSAEHTMRPMVRTTLCGSTPTDVSPESMTASAPSSTALATSDASARVGREFSIIESSICVATITGLAFSRAIWITRFCTAGTCSSGISTPRSPRATITASNARMMDSSASTASGFSSLATTGTRRPTSSMISCTSSTSAGERTNDNAMMSTPRRSAKRRSALSFSLSAGTEMSIPGSETPLLLDTGPPSVTRQTTSLPSTSVHTRPTLPSSTSRRSPGLASWASCLYVVETRSWVPSTSSTVMRTVSPVSQ